MANNNLIRVKVNSHIRHGVEGGEVKDYHPSDDPTAPTVLEVTPEEAVVLAERGAVSLPKGFQAPESHVPAHDRVGAQPVENVIREDESDSSKAQG